MMDGWIRTLVHELQQNLLFNDRSFLVSLSFTFWFNPSPFTQRSWANPWTLAWFKKFFFWIWGLIFGYVFRLGKTRLHEFFQIYRPINTSGPPMWSFNGNFNGKMAKNRFLAIKSSRSVLQPSSYHCWATFLYLFSGIPHLPLLVTYGPMARWPFLAILAIFGHFGHFFHEA